MSGRSRKDERKRGQTCFPSLLTVVIFLGVPILIYLLDFALRWRCGLGFTSGSGLFTTLAAVDASLLVSYDTLSALVVEPLRERAVTLIVTFLLLNVIALVLLPRTRGARLCSCSSRK